MKYEHEMELIDAEGSGEASNHAQEVEILKS
jgi:hypothetical protein